MTFFYPEAFSRNIGWVSEYEQQLLKSKKVAIAGMGGVGGIYLLTCVSLGIEHFHIADFDSFELGNFNRQVGANISTINKEKTETLKRMALDINPNCDIKIFSKGVNKENIHDFLDEVDLYLDGIDLFAMNARRLIFQQCHEKKISAITAGPLGMGSAYMIFTPKSMSFENYFDFKSSQSEEENLIKFMVGLAPTGLHRDYLMDQSRINFKIGKGPSTIMGCQLCAGIAVTEGLKLFLDRGKTYAAPYTHQFDAYKNKYKRSYVPFGNRNFLQKLKLKLAKKFINSLLEETYPYGDSYDDPIDRIMDFAKWAPSGHNEQICEWTHLSKQTIELVVHETSAPFNTYEKKRVTLNMLGIFLETLEHAAHFFGYKVTIDKNYKKDKKNYYFKIKFSKLTKPIHNLGEFIKARFTDRRPYKLTKLLEKQKKSLESILEKNYSILWEETLNDKIKTSYLNAKCMKLEAQDPRYYDDLKHAIKFDTQFSTTGIPDASFNFSTLTRFLMKKIFPHKNIFQIINNKLAGFVSSIIEISLIPDMCSGAHILLKREEKDILKTDSKEFLEQAIMDGRMIQRFWLKSTSIGLVLQPTFIKLIFSREPNDRSYTKNSPKIIKMLEKIRACFIKTYHSNPEIFVFSARIGEPKDRKIYAISTRI